MRCATMEIDRLIAFAVKVGLIEEEDRLFHRNLLLDAMKLDAPEAYREEVAPLGETMTDALEALGQIAFDKGIIGDEPNERDCFTRRLAGLITPSPAAVREKFAMLRETEGAKAATDWFYGMCRYCDYIRVDQVSKNVEYPYVSDTRELVVTINLSKPEKDPREIAKLKNAPKLGYPKCPLCPENPGYAGRSNFAARQNHRIVPMELSGQKWYMQYSPYVYYNEHCIVLSSEHRDMCVSRGTFERMFEFVEQFPHYFIGSNADLPIVGGSILNHDHFQGGRFEFPMDRAKDEIILKYQDERVKAAIIDWPMSCVRLTGTDKTALTDAAERILTAWRKWEDVSCFIYAGTKNAPHNTITPILRKNGEEWALSLVLRNNVTTHENPLGVFHPHADLHHIKKENIGLIEVMGLFILPGRLLKETEMLSKYLTGEIAIDTVPEKDDPMEKHYSWIKTVAEENGTNLSHDEAMEVIRKAIGKKCERVLADAGVYKQTTEGRNGMLRFLANVGFLRA